jgi:hypothetical protein
MKIAQILVTGGALLGGLFPRREAEVVKNWCPRMGLVPKCSIFNGLSYAIRLEKIGWGPLAWGPKFKLHFFVSPSVFYL